MSLSRPWLLPAAALLAAVGAVASPASAVVTPQNLGEQNLGARRVTASSIQNSKLKTQNSKLSPQPETLIAQSSPELEEAERLTDEAYKLYQQGKYAEAVPLIQQALAIRRRILGDDHPDTAISLNNLALLYSAQGRYGEAESLYKQALAIVRRVLGEDHPNTAISLSSLALLYQSQGRYGEAEPLHQQALAIVRRVLGEDHPDTATGLNNLADLYRAQGRYGEAETLYQQALAIRRRVLGEDHPNTATSLNNLALLYRTQGRYGEAEPLHQKALAIRRRVLGEDHPDTALSLNNLALLYYAQGRYGEAEPLYQKALAIVRRVLGEDHPHTALSLGSLALLYSAQGRYGEAEPLYQKALAIVRRVLGDDHPDTATSLNNLAGLYWFQGNLPQAVAHLNQGMEVQEVNLANILAMGSERRKQNYFATVSGITYGTLSLHLQDAPNNADAARLALTTLLRRKGRILDATSSGLQLLRQNLTDADQQLLDQLNATRTQIANQIFKGVGDQDPADYRQQVAQLKGKADQLETQLSQRSAEFRVESQPVTIEAVQQQIPADAALVELVKYPPFNAKVTGTESKWGSPRYAAYVLQRQGKPKWVDLGEAEPIDRAAAAFRRVLRDTISKPPEARALDELLMQPIRPLLGNAKHLLISPDSELNLIPFAALRDETGQFLVERYEISYLTSGRDLLKLQLDTPSRQAPVLVANADFDNPGNPLLPADWQGQTVSVKSAARNAETGSTTDKRGNQRSQAFQKLKFGHLEGTKQEAAAIAPMLPKVTLLTEDRATENAIKQVKGPSILHIASHGFFLKNAPLVAAPDYGIGFSSRGRSLGVVSHDGAGGISPQAQVPAENPLLRSGLALAGFNVLKSGQDDGALTALEMSGIDLYGTELVVLSACETGLGEVANGEGVYGLRRALVLAGSRSQVISLWKVADKQTKDFMVAYYQKLKQGMGRSEALRQVQLEMLRDPNYRLPYFWAAFIPSGDWRGMEF